MKQTVTAKNGAPPGGPYSQGIRAGDFLFVSGQGPRNPQTNEMPENFKEQVRQCLNNVRVIVEAGGGTMDQVVKVNAYLADMTYFSEWNEVYKEFFKEPYPTRTTVGVHMPKILVEVDVIVYLGQ